MKVDIYRLTVFTVLYSSSPPMNDRKPIVTLRGVSE